MTKICDSKRRKMLKMVERLAERNARECTVDR